MRLAMSSPRRFPPSWSIEELEACFVVRDHDGQALGEEPGGKRKQALSFAAMQRTGRAKHSA